MRVIKRAILLLLLGLATYSAALGSVRAQEWVEFVSREGRFKILMPLKPTLEIKEVETDVGKLNSYNYSVQNSKAYFLASYSDYPFAPPDAVSLDKVLDNVRDGVIKGLGAELLAENKISLESNPGRVFRARKKVANVNAIFNWRVYLVGRRLYQLAVATSEADSQSPQVPKFFTSFGLTK